MLIFLLALVLAKKASILLLSGMNSKLGIEYKNSNRYEITYSPTVFILSMKIIDGKKKAYIYNTLNRNGLFLRNNVLKDSPGTGDSWVFKEIGNRRYHKFQLITDGRCVEAMSMEFGKPGRLEGRKCDAKKISQIFIVKILELEEDEKPVDYSVDSTSLPYHDDVYDRKASYRNLETDDMFSESTSELDYMQDIYDVDYETENYKYPESKTDHLGIKKNIEYIQSDGNVYDIKIKPLKEIITSISYLTTTVEKYMTPIEVTEYNTSTETVTEYTTSIVTTTNTVSVPLKETSGNIRQKIQDEENSESSSSLTSNTDISPIIPYEDGRKRKMVRKNRHKNTKKPRINRRRQQYKEEKEKDLDMTHNKDLEVYRIPQDNILRSEPNYLTPNPSIAQNGKCAPYSSPMLVSGRIKPFRHPNTNPGNSSGIHGFASNTTNFPDGRTSKNFISTGLNEAQMKNIDLLMEHKNLEHVFDSIMKDFG